MMLIGSLGVVVVLFIGWFYRHQVLLKDRAHLMREAIRNQEFTFRLPVKGLFFGERALQEALNETGRDIGRVLARNEVESWQRLTRVLTQSGLSGASCDYRNGLRGGDPCHSRYQPRTCLVRGQLPETGGTARTCYRRGLFE